MDDTRMIEDFIPVREISKSSVREKMGGHYLSKGQLRNLHLWWARRPLAASRAAVYATFAPKVEDDKKNDLQDFFASLCDYKGPVLPEVFAIKEARHTVSTSAQGKRPKVLDMFAGGGAIPLEALRLGADVISLDLNPVAHLIQRCALEFPQTYEQALYDAVQEWGSWVIEQTRAEVADLYPDIIPETKTSTVQAPQQQDLLALPVKKSKKAKGTPTPSNLLYRPIAYLWTRTIPSPARGFERGQVPLVRQTWLNKKSGNFVALRPIVDRDALTVTFKLVTSAAKTEKLAIQEWGFNPDFENARGSTTCPYSGQTVTANDAKEAGVRGEMKHQFMALIAVEHKDGKEKGKRFFDLSLIHKDHIQKFDTDQRIDKLCS